MASSDKDQNDGSNLVGWSPSVGPLNPTHDIIDRMSEISLGDDTNDMQTFSRSSTTTSDIKLTDNDNSKTTEQSPPTLTKNEQQGNPVEKLSEKALTKEQRKALFEKERAAKGGFEKKKPYLSMTNSARQYLQAQPPMFLSQNLTEIHSFTFRYCTWSTLLNPDINFFSQM